jgi:hypothetical protein
MNDQVTLTEEQRKSLAANRGCVQGEGYVLMSSEVFREMMGIGSDDELAASLEAIEEGHADVEAGRTRPFREVLAELGRDHAVRR